MKNIPKFLWAMFTFCKIKCELIFESQVAEELFSPCLPDWLWNTLQLMSTQHP